MHGRERAGRAVHAIDTNAAALLIGEIDKIPSGVKAVVSRAHELCLLHPEWRVGRQSAALRVEPELRDEIGAGIVLRRFEDIVLQAGDVRDEGEAV